MPKLSSRVLASSGYSLDVESFGANAFNVWEDRTAKRQDAAWQPIIQQAKQGRLREDVASLFQALDNLPEGELRVLESGCGGGYNAELLAMWNPRIDYLGVDISPAMVGLARQHYPHREFRIGSAYDLPVEDGSQDLVIDGVALLHMTDWPLAIAEYGRVSKQKVILHGLTITDDAPTTRFAKYAYGQPSLELVFNRQQLLMEAARAGLELIETHPGLDYDLAPYLGIPSVSEAWVLAKSS
ncbi:class I SAM-dependent methyltransferase [Microbacterium sp. STN6]|uniref:class I SAM-dependent methyltransferase n=1 Tax=Microbacterium sp. STN6 TaxID=2995588 RepID=UPI0022609470|nr:class I SAM-dependent methyltransferase [Microbacterium sp. STN6]MCX7521041.1 class I SAM-dependent methyltransferase [Microbacterium sp. STN6]